MKTKRRLSLPVIPIILLLSFIFGTVGVNAAAGTTALTDTIALTPGFYCLHPHKKTPSPTNPIEMTAVPSTEYDGYSQDTLDQVAAAVVLQGEYYTDTGIIIDNGSLQSVIWAIVCKRPECIMRNGENLHLNGRDVAKQYYTYVMDNYQRVKNDYTMTIWVSSDQEYQDILEAKRVEKHGVPSVEKKVLDTNDTDNTGDAAIGWQDSADYDIGDTIPFQITATLSDMPDFKSYYLEFVDQMEHLTLMEDSIKVMIGDKDVKKYFTVSSLADPENKCITKLNLSCDNILSIGKAEGIDIKKGTKFVLTYNAKLHDDAVIGNPGNPNQVHLVYTRSSGTADKGITPDDKVKVFTYKMSVHKVDEDETTPLVGAAFKLSKKMSDGTYKTVSVVGATEDNGVYTLTGEKLVDFEWTGIDDGTYKLEEVVTPEGHNTMKPLEFWVKACHEEKSEDPSLLYLNSNYDGFDEWMPVEWIQYLDGITIPDDVEGYIDVSQSGEFNTSIVNKRGSVLPTTGGMGTKLFYLVGAILVIVAGVLLISRKRMQG